MSIEREQVKINEPILCRGSYKERFINIDGSEASTFIAFNEPHDAIGSFLEIGIANFQKHDVQLNAVYGKKEDCMRESSGDSLVIFTFNTPRGIFILTDIEDGFSAIDTDCWIEARAKTAKLPSSPDIFFSMLNHDYADSKEVRHWMGSTNNILKQLSPKIDSSLSIPNHQSPVIEIALKEIIRSYLTTKNSYRKIRLGEIFFQTNPGKELVNGIFGVSGIFVPKEAGVITEVKGESISGSTVGGFSVCRSLADIGIYTTFPSLSLHLTDANAFFDLFVSNLNKILNEEQRLVVRNLIYSKIDKLYAAFNMGDVAFPLTEEESQSGIVDKVPGIRLAGGTDGAYYPERTHKGQPEELFLNTLAKLIRDPRSLLRNMRSPADDYLMYSISFS